MFEYKVECRDGAYQASVPYRQCVWVGDTEREAIGYMLMGIAELAYNGSIDPDEPQAPGCAPLQHVMNVLSDQLVFQLARRQERTQDALVNCPGQEPEVPDIGKLNDVISGLGTAIAALARIKTL